MGLTYDPLALSFDFAPSNTFQMHAPEFVGFAISFSCICQW